MNFIAKRLLSACACVGLASQAGAVNVVIVDGSNVSTSCGALTSLSQNATELTLTVTGSCLAAAGGGGNGGGGNEGGGNEGGGNGGGGNEGGGNGDGGNEGGGNEGGGNGGGDTCQSGNGIVCKGSIENGNYTLPAFEMTTINLPAGKTHVYSFVYRASIGEAKMGPMFGGTRIMKISATPGDISPSNDGCYQVQRNNLSPMRYENANSSRSPYACDLVDGVRYYFNIKTRLRGTDVYRLYGSAAF